MIKALTNWFQILAGLGGTAIIVFALVTFPKTSFYYIFAMIFGGMLLLEYLGSFIVRNLTSIFHAYFTAKSAGEFGVTTALEKYRAEQHKLE